MQARVGIDTGGTFTDLVLLDGAGKTTRLKIPSTPADPAEALIEGLRRLVALAPNGSPEAVAHGTTVATNAMLEERFQTLALVNSWLPARSRDRASERSLRLWQLLLLGQA